MALIHLPVSSIRRWRWGHSFPVRTLHTEVFKQLMFKGQLCLVLPYSQAKEYARTHERFQMGLWVSQGGTHGPLVLHPPFRWGFEPKWLILSSIVCETSSNKLIKMSLSSLRPFNLRVFVLFGEAWLVLFLTTLELGLYLSTSHAATPSGPVLSTGFARQTGRGRPGFPDFSGKMPVSVDLADCLGSKVMADCLVTKGCFFVLGDAPCRAG